MQSTLKANIMRILATDGYTFQNMKANQQPHVLSILALEQEQKAAHSQAAASPVNSGPADVKLQKQSRKHRSCLCGPV